MRKKNFTAGFKRVVPFRILFFCIICNAYGQKDTVFVDLQSPLPGYDVLFSQETPLICTLKTDIKNFQKEKYKTKYQTADLIYRHNDRLISKRIRIKTRGIVRKKICSLPPIRLNVQKVNKDSTFLHGASKIKLVTHCNSGSNFSDYLLKEYLTYKIYNLLTPYSFRVRLLRITYIDTGRKNKEQTSWGFIIEPIHIVAKRNECVPIKSDVIGIHQTDSAVTDLLAMWSYMVGNTDWSVAGRHNIKLIKSIDFKQPAPIPVPYDMDYSGFVNTSYAVPGEGLGLENVRERLFVGPCRELTDYEIARDSILIKKTIIYELINSFELLDKRDKQSMIVYLDTYFRQMERENFIKYHIDVDCRESGFEKANSLF